MEQIGITLTLDVQQAAQQRQMMRNYQLPFFRGSWICDYPDPENYLSLFYSKNLQPNGSNYTHYVNPKYDKLFEKSQCCLNDSLRNIYYTQLDAMLMEDAPIVVLYYDKVLRFVGTDVEGMDTNPINMLDLRRVKIKLKTENWKLKTENWKLKVENWKLKTESWKLKIKNNWHILNGFAVIFMSLPRPMGTPSKRRGINHLLVPLAH